MVVVVLSSLVISASGRSASREVRRSTLLRRQASMRSSLVEAPYSMSVGEVYEGRGRVRTSCSSSAIVMLVLVFVGGKCPSYQMAGQLTTTAAPCTDVPE